MKALIFIYRRRLTLLKSTLSNLSIYCLSLFVIQKGVHSRLKQIKKEFLWQGNFLEKKPHLVNWYTVCINDKIKKLKIKK